MFCRIAGVTAAALLISGAVWAQTGGSSGGSSTTPDSGAATQAPGTDQSGASSSGTMGTQSGTTDTQSGTTETTQTTTTTTTTQTTTGTTEAEESRAHVELSGFAGYTFNNALNLNTGSGSVAANFYDNVGPRDRFTYGASLGYDFTPNLMIGFLWSAQNDDRLQVSNFNSTAATAVGFTPRGKGTTGTGTGGTTATGAVTVYPILGTANGATSYEIGKMNVNNFHGIVQYEFGSKDALIRPFVYGGAGVTRYGAVNYSYANQVVSGTGATATTMSQTVNATFPSINRFSTTWGIGFQVAPYKGLGIRIAGRWTPTRLSNSGFATPPAAGSGTGATSTTPAGNAAWWCNAFSGCSSKGSLYQNQWAVTGGLTVRF